MRAHNAISTRGNIPCNIVKHKQCTQLQNWKQSFGAESRTAAMLAPRCSHSQVLIWAMIIIMHKSSSLPLPFFGWTGIATPAQGCGLSLNFRTLKKPQAFIIWMTENELCSRLARLELSTLSAGMQACLGWPFFCGCFVKVYDILSWWRSSSLEYKGSGVWWCRRA